MRIPERLRSVSARLSSRRREERVGLSETITLIRRYVVQETVGPLRSIGRVLAFGLSGAFVGGLGMVFILVGILRVFETETGRVFAGDWSFAPYLLTAAAGLVFLGCASLVALRTVRGLGAGRDGA